jgi:hypothetical protein
MSSPAFVVDAHAADSQLALALLNATCSIALPALWAGSTMSWCPTFGNTHCSPAADQQRHIGWWRTPFAWSMSRVPWIFGDDPWRILGGGAGRFDAGVGVGVPT